MKLLLLTLFSTAISFGLPIINKNGGSFEATLLDVINKGGGQVEVKVKRSSDQSIFSIDFCPSFTISLEFFAFAKSNG